MGDFIKQLPSGPLILPEGILPHGFKSAWTIAIYLQGSHHRVNLHGIAVQIHGENLQCGINIQKIEGGNIKLH
jgi:hypothetical protein